MAKRPRKKMIHSRKVKTTRSDNPVSGFNKKKYDAAAVWDRMKKR